MPLNISCSRSTGKYPRKPCPLPPETPQSDDERGLRTSRSGHGACQGRPSLGATRRNQQGQSPGRERGRQRRPNKNGVAASVNVAVGRCHHGAFGVDWLDNLLIFQDAPVLNMVSVKHEDGFSQHNACHGQNIQVVWALTPHPSLYLDVFGGM